jgi:hypothetical protein
MTQQPITMTEAEELGVPACFSAEYAFHERNGTLPPYSGPVCPDYGSDASYLYDDPEPASDYPPAPPPPVSLVKQHFCSNHLCCPPF